MVARNKSAAPLDTPNQGDTLTDLTLDIAFIPLSLDGVDAAGMAEPLGGPVTLMALDGPYRVTASARNMTVPEVELRDGMLNDNAAAESFFATVKLEAIPEGIFASRQQARLALFDYIEVFYNRERLHSGIGYARPVSHAA